MLQTFFQPPADIRELVFQSVVAVSRENFANGEIHRLHISCSLGVDDQGNFPKELSLFLEELQVRLEGVLVLDDDFGQALDDEIHFVSDFPLSDDEVVRQVDISLELLYDPHDLVQLQLVKQGHILDNIAVKVEMQLFLERLRQQRKVVQVLRELFLLPAEVEVFQHLRAQTLRNIVVLQLFFQLLQFFLVLAALGVQSAD